MSVFSPLVHSCGKLPSGTSGLSATDPQQHWWDATGRSRGCACRTSTTSPCSAARRRPWRRLPIVTGRCLGWGQRYEPDSGVLTTELRSSAAVVRITFSVSARAPTCVRTSLPDGVSSCVLWWFLDGRVRLKMMLEPGGGHRGTSRRATRAHGPASRTGHPADGVCAGRGCHARLSIEPTSRGPLLELCSDGYEPGAAACVEINGDGPVRLVVEGRSKMGREELVRPSTRRARRRGPCPGKGAKRQLTR